MIEKRVGSMVALVVVALSGCGVSDPVAAFEKDLTDTTGVTLNEFLDGNDRDEGLWFMCSGVETLGKEQTAQLIRSDFNQVSAEGAAELVESLQRNICDNEAWGDLAPPVVTTSATQQPTTAAAPATAEEVEAAPAEESAVESGTLVYEVTSDADSATNVSYATFDNGGFGQEMATDAALPFIKEIEIGGQDVLNPQMFILSAQASVNASTISCKISLDGEVLAEQTSTGSFTVVICTGR